MQNIDCHRFVIYTRLLSLVIFIRTRGSKQKKLKKHSMDKNAFRIYIVKASPTLICKVVWVVDEGQSTPRCRLSF